MTPIATVSLQQAIEDRGVRCGFAEPQFDPALLLAAGEGGTFRIVELDPLGARLETGPEFYPHLLEAMADALVACLSEGR